jgi:hypothetical protein
MWEEGSKGRREPPSRESVIWTLVSLVMRERELRRRGRAEEDDMVGEGTEMGGSVAMEPIFWMCVYVRIRSSLYAVVAAAVSLSSWSIGKVLDE